MAALTAGFADTIAIESPQHLSETLRSASERGQPFVPLGGGTAIFPCEELDAGAVAIDTSRLHGVDEYVSTDMTASFAAGTPLRSIRDTLRANGQELPVDIADDEAGTIGGLVATGHAGPRRLGNGTLKDLIIGCEYVRGDGLLAKAGGTTVKNVSGFDLGRFLHGSWGALAVITRINMKVVPIAPADITLEYRDDTIDGALARQSRLIAAVPESIALNSLRDEQGWITRLRLQGRLGTLRAVVEGLDAPDGTVDSVQPWLDHARRWRDDPQDPTLIVSGGAEDVRELAVHLAGTDCVGQMAFSLPLGTVRARFRGESMPIASELLPRLWMIGGGSSACRRQLNVWGPPRNDIGIVRAIKREFDPQLILNRGRLFI